MTQKENIDMLLQYIHQLDETVTKMKETEIYPASFFDQTMGLASNIMEEIHQIEANQIEMLQKQLEAHQALLQTIKTKNIQVEAMPEKQQEEDPATSQPEEKKQDEEAQEVIVEETTTVEQEILPTLSEEKEVCSEKKDYQPGKKDEPKQENELTTMILPSKEQTTQSAPIPSTNEQRQGLFLNDVLEKKNLSDFKKAFSLNDRFRFRRELFHNNEKEMEQAINDLNTIQSYEESIDYLNRELKWDMEEQAVKDFVLLLEKRFL